jgi:two-component system sensor histidine kinase HydH
MPDERKRMPKKTEVYLIIILVIASVATLLSTIIIYRNSLRAAEESLKLQALGIAASLEPSLQAPHVKENIFKDIITEASWEGIAFLALYDRTGLTLLHSNENLVGRRIDSPDIKIAADEERPIFNRMTLGTDEEVFILNYPIHARDAIKVLKLALHPYPAQDVIRQARLQAMSIAVTILIIWIMGFFFIKAVKRSEQLSAMMAERERLAVIGEMAAVLAHEIRNPLGSIKGFAQYLSEKGTEGRGELDVIIEEAGRLERLTEDLLLYARPSEVRAGQFNLLEAADEAMRLLADHLKMAAKRTNVSIPPDMVMLSDKEKVKQILSNLLQNAIDAVSEGGLIELGAVQTGNKTLIVVRDNGSGMDAETRSKAFDSFFSSKAKGTGLGLAIVDRLTKALGGSTEIESATREGTVVRITLPTIYGEEEHE